MLSRSWVLLAASAPVKEGKRACRGGGASGSGAASQTKASRGLCPRGRLAQPGARTLVPGLRVVPRMRTLSRTASWPPRVPELCHGRAWAASALLRPPWRRDRRPAGPPSQ